jgi:hypothetical protein
MYSLAALSAVYILTETDRFDGDICNLPIAIGSCDESVERWYWDRVTQSCERFMYSGCDGNENNFERKEDCSSICGGDLSEVNITPTEEPVSPDDEGWFSIFTL